MNEKDDLLTIKKAHNQMDGTKQITLRSFCNKDIALMERWLFIPHVAKWYKHPDHWLRELRARHREFSFLTHFIAELNGKPVGFCQYYDCYFAQNMKFGMTSGMSAKSKARYTVLIT